MINSGQETIPATPEQSIDMQGLSSAEAQDYFALRAATAKQSQGSKFNRASGTQIQAWAGVESMSRELADPAALEAELQADVQKIETGLAQDSGNSNPDRRDRELVGILKEALKVLGEEAMPQEVEKARRLLEEKRQAKTEKESDQAAAAAEPIDLTEARRKVEAVHEDNEKARLVAVVVEAARGSVAGNVNTSQGIMERAITRAESNGRVVSGDRRQGWNSWGEAPLAGVASPSDEYAEKQREVLRESTISGQPVPPISEVRIGKESEDGKVELGVTILVPNKVDEFGRFASNISVGAKVPKELAEKVRQASEADPSVARQIVEALMFDYGFPPEVMQSNKI